MGLCSSWFLFGHHSGPVLFVCDLFHPVDNLALELFLNGDMRHGGGRRPSVPMLLARREPDHIAWPDLLDRPAPALRPTATGRHDEGLAQRMDVPCGAGAWLESDTGPLHQRRVGRLKKRIDAYRAGEPLRRSLAGRLRANSLDVHSGLL